MEKMKKIAILGSTGSIGTQTLEVARENGDLDIVGLAVCIFLHLSVVPVLYRSVVACNTAVNLGYLTAVRTLKLFSG